MKKKLVVLMLVALVGLAAAAPALAAGRGGDADNRHADGNQRPRLPGRQYFTLVGIITEVSGDTITVEVYHGNRFVKPYIGLELAVQVNAGTEYRRWTPTGCVPIDPDEVTVGDTTSIHGMVSDETFVASRVTVDVPLDCCTP